MRSTSQVFGAEVDPEVALHSEPLKNELLLAASAPAGPPGADEGKGDFRKLVLPVFFPQIPAYGVNSLLTPILPGYVMQHYGLNAARAGLASACMFMSPVILDLPQNIIADKVGPHALGIAAALCLIGAGVVGVAADVLSCFPLLLLARIFNGCGQSLWQMSRVLILARAPSKIRATAMATVGGMQRLGSLICPMLGSALALHFTIYGVFVAQILLGFMVLLLAVLPVLLPETTKLVPRFVLGSGVKSADKQTSVRGTLRCAVRNWRDFATAGLASLMLAWLRQAKDFLIVLKINQLGGGPAMSGLAVTLAYVFDFSCSPVAGVLMSRFGRKFSLAPALLMLGLACGLLGTDLASTPHSVLAIACLAGAGNGISSGLGMTLGSDIAVLREQEGLAISKSEFLGPWREMQDCGMLLGPAISGALVTVFSFPVAAATCAAIGSGAALFTAWSVEETLQPE